MLTARRKAWCPLETSFLWFYLPLSYKRRTLRPTPSLPLMQGPTTRERKIHHFLWLCELLINSRQKGLIRKLFRKLKGRGRRPGLHAPVEPGLFLSKWAGAGLFSFATSSHSGPNLVYSGASPDGIMIRLGRGILGIGKAHIQGVWV